MNEPSPTLEAFKAFFPKQTLQWLGPISALALVVATAAVVVITTGSVAFPASQKDAEGAADLVHTAFKNSVREHSRKIEVPTDLDAAWRTQLGAGHYARVCAACHGEPGLGQSPIATSMRPRPQYLANVVQEFDDRELFWIVQNGVKFSGMPAWPHPEREDEIWSVVAFLKQIKTMPPQEYAHQAFGEAANLGAKGSEPPTSERSTYSVKDDDEPPADQFSYTWPAVGFHNPTLDLTGTNGCAGCHGEHGNGRAGGMAPNLTLQSPEYLQKALQSFASGQRPSGIMQSVATQLTDGAMQQLAQQYGSRVLPTAGAELGPKDSVGASIALQGLPARQVPACTSCHGVAGVSTSVFPQLAGQNREYLVQQLKLFKADKRGGAEVSAPMSGIAHDLSDNEIASVASYFSSQVPSGIAKPAK